MAAARKLVLHFDVNETIMVGDPASGVDFESSLNHILAKVAFLDKDNKDFWHDGTPLDLAKRKDGEIPPLLTNFDAETGPVLKCYEANRKNALWPPSKFTDPGLPGEIYRPLFEELKQQLQWKASKNEVFAPDGHHFLLPAFFHTLAELEKQGRDFTLVIRTFGTDLPEVARCLQAFARGEHPDFPQKFERFGLALEDALWVLRREDRSDVQSPIYLRRYEEHLGKEGLGQDMSAPDRVSYTDELGPDEKVVDFIAPKPVLAIRDDYHHWRKMRYVPESGKPLWISLDDDVQHIFFDDNIHNKAHDSIVAVRARKSSSEPFRAVSGEVTRLLEGVLLVKAHPVEAIRDKDYFLREIQRCEEKFELMSKHGSLRGLLQPA
ncbi:unnamed protein product [Durusdinium trenchii]|uniref:Uncharacterized protein n=2 Tax=Durusdinium trenchii TaxID=1381693 RepID=A0ABP0MUJ2_9DINO